MKRCLLFFFVPALLAAAPSPLVVGSIRDQFGAPIAGARVSAGGMSTTTDARGTFALAEADVQAVMISCAYCQELSVRVTPGEPVVALVHRYDALTQDAPTQRDIASVPYARAESLVSLRPFTVLENSSHALPGPQVSDRGTSSRGALLFDDGIPVYDIAAGQSPFVTFPAYTLQDASWLPPSDAFTYGDLAGGGTLFAQTHAADRWSGVAAGANTNALRIGETLDNASWSAAASQDPTDQRTRGDGFLRVPFGDDALSVAAIASEDHYTPALENLDTSIGGVRLNFESLRENHVNASIIADGGYYDGTAENLKYSAQWSDLQAQAGVATNTRIQFFADANVRASSGEYTTSAVIPNAAALIGQTRIDMGAQTAGDRYDLRIGAGAFDFAYTGGVAGTHSAISGGMLAPSFSGSYAFDPQWTLQLQAAESFTLPTVLEAFEYPPDGPAMQFDRNALLLGTLEYGDLRRFRAAATAMSEHVSGLDTGAISSAGISASWQFAPKISLRAWMLHVNDATLPYEPLYRFGARPQPATVGSYWLTYESSGLRVDAIYRRDLLDYAPDPHFDASVSAPVAGGFRLFVQTERRAGSRGVTIGLRAAAP